MYTILINEDNTASTTKKERIMQRSKLVDNLQFLVPQFYKERDMTDFTVMLEYILPCSKKYKTEILELDEEMYEDHLRYKVPFDSELTTEPGTVEMQLTFVKADLDENGKPIQLVRKTSTVKITIVPIAAWADIVPDEALSSLDQRILKLDAQMRELGDYADALAESQVDNLSYNDEENSLQLLAGENAVGDKVKLKTAVGGVDEDGVPVIDLSDFHFSEVDPDNPEEGFSDIVEF